MPEFRLMDIAYVDRQSQEIERLRAVLAGLAAHHMGWTHRCWNGPCVCEWHTAAREISQKCDTKEQTEGEHDRESTGGAPRAETADL